ALLNKGLMGLFWSIEALLLIHLGFTTRLPVVRKEGYLLLLIGLGKIAFSSFFFFITFGSLRHPGYYNFTALGIVFLALWLQSAKYKSSLQKFERIFYYLFRNGFSVWLSVWVMITGYQLIGEWAFPFSVLPVFALSWWGSKLKSTTLMAIGFIYLFPLLQAFLISASEVGSLFFDQQRLYAQISLVLFMGSLWFLKRYYQMIGQQKSGINGFVHGLRILFFLIIALIPITIARRHAPELIPAAGWVSVLISYALYKKLKYMGLQIEFAILFVLAFIATFFQLSTPVLGIGILSLVIIHLAEKSYNQTSLEKSDFGITLKVSPYMVYLLISILVFKLLGGDIYYFPVLLFCTLLLVTVLLKDKLAFIKESAGVAITTTILVGAILGIFMIFERAEWFDNLLLISNLMILAVLFLNRKQWYTSYTSFKWSMDFVYYQLLLIFSYLSILSLFNVRASSAVMTVLLAIHAVALLFLALKNKLKLPNYLSIIIFSFTTLKIIFADIASLPTTQKVVVLIALGALLLGASYAYTRLKKYFDDKNQQEFNEKLIAREESNNEETTDDPIS
ncbi:MAG: hypothetical protein AAFN93_21380, partial [Bacteroidota bacterium]